MRWVAIVLVSLVLIALWTAAFFFPDLRWIAGIVTAVFVLLAVVVVLVILLRRRMKAAAMKRDLAQKAMANDPDERPEIIAVRAEVHRAAQALKERRRGAGGGRAALYRLPCYVLVGPQAAGKTTALERNGYTPLSSAPPGGGGVPAAPGCEWWLSSEAVIVDTPGRYATEDHDRDEWVAFLDALRHSRPERPLDGLVVAVSAAELVAASETERERLAAQLRARLAEALRRLEMVLPVYLVVTKADRITGFEEFWSDLDDRGREQAWGATFPLDDPRLDDVSRAVEEELDVLAANLHSRLPDRLPAEPGGESRARILQFPLEFRAMRAPLSRFAAALCPAGSDHDVARLRGLYFTSGTQVGRGAERAPSAVPRAFFLADLFRRVIVPDRGAAVRSAAGGRRRSGRELRVALAALCVAAFVLVVAIVSYVHNAELARAVDGATGALKAAPTASLPGTADDPLEPMLDTLERLDDEAAGFGVPGWFGPRAARRLREPLRAAYVRRIHGALRQLVAPELEKSLSAIARSRRLEDSIASPEDHTPLRNAYEVIKLDATLVDPVDHVEHPWTPEELARVWERTLAGRSPVGSERLLKHATNYLAALEVAPDLRWPVTPALLEARARVKDLGVGQLPYHWALRRAYDQPPILASDVADGASLKYLTCPPNQVLVAGSYTATAWQKIAPVLEAPDPWPPAVLVERWVLGDTRIPKDEAATRAQVRDQYYDSYSGEWMSLLDKCAVSRPSDFAAAKDELTSLKDSKGFYRTLFTQFANNAIAAPEKKEPPAAILVTEGCASKLASLKADASAPPAVKTVSPVQKSFQPLLVFSGDAEDAKKPAPLEKYTTILETLRATLETANDTPGGADPRAQFATAKQGVEALLDGLQEPSKSKLFRLLMPPVDGTVKVTETGRVDSTSSEWKKKVWNAWDGKLSKLFPFNRATHEAANYEDFRSFFQPGGTLWTFVQANLADWVELGDAVYAAKPGANPLGPEVLSCLTVAREIADAFFPSGEDPGLRFSVLADWTAPDVTEAKFWIGDKSTPLPRSQWSPPLRWNGEGVRLEWVQAARPTQEIGRHSFSLFDLFEQLGGLKPAEGGRRGLYAADYPPLIVKVRSDGKKDGLKADFFSRLACPPEIRADGP